MFIVERLPQAAPGESLCLLSKGKVFRCSTEVGKRGSSANRFLIQFKTPLSRTGRVPPARTPKPGFQKGLGHATGAKGWSLLCVWDLEVRGQMLPLAELGRETSKSELQPFACPVSETKRCWCRGTEVKLHLGGQSPPCK